MTVSYGFYDSLNGDRKYNAQQMSRIFEGIITNGVFQSVGSALVVSAVSGMNISVGTGRAWFNYTWTYNDAALQLTVEASEAVLNRIDTVILEVNTDTAVRANSIKILKGTPGSSPVAPTLANTATLKQYGLADIYVGAGVTQIIAGNITNRVGTVGTPFITGILETLDAATLLARFESDFDVWLTNLQDQLDDNQASNLQAQIDQLVSGWIPAGETWSYTAADAPIFSITVPGNVTGKYKPGQRVKITQDSVTKYFIIHLVTFLTPNTILSVYGGTLHTLTNSAITNPTWSPHKAPLGFPLEADKWTVTATNSANAAKTNPTNGVWYGGNGLTPDGPSIVLPIGSWHVSYSATVAYASNTAAVANIGVKVTLSAQNNTESDDELTAAFLMSLPANASLLARSQLSREKALVITSKQTYYLNLTTGLATGTNPSISYIFKTVLRARSTYL
jgi:hypothetical protein